MPKGVKPAKKQTEEKPENERSPIAQYIINKVRERRKESGLKQEPLSFEVDRSHSYISQYETESTGKMYSIEMLNELAKALKCSPKDFWPEEPL